MTNHPLADFSAHVRNYKCFGLSSQGWQRFEPINLIVGRNNSGKSSLIDLVQLCCTQGSSYNPARHGRDGKPFQLIVSETLTEPILRSVFSESTSGGEIGMNHWEFGKRFIGARAVRELQGGLVKLTHIFAAPENEVQVPPQHRQELEKRMGWRFSELELVRISAERDIGPENRDVTLQLSSSGVGVTNVIRAFINSDRLPTYEVTDALLDDLNFIYREDSRFDEINCQESDDGMWELFLHEESKGNVRLSESGSSLKTVFLVLAYLRLLPHFTKVDWSKSIFCVEEPENNLHPALLRRLLEFLATARDERQFTLVMTTHSPICIDWCAKRSDSQIVHVSHDGISATASVSLGYKQNKGILDDLDVRASDILQSNGIIWVEGPSDRVYINRWIELAGGGEIKEGIHYQVMFYAGKLLFHLDALPPEESDTLISLLSMNRNVALLMDSDRHQGTKTSKPRMNLNRTKRRVRDEFDSIGGFVWVTEGREVENYISRRALKLLGQQPLFRVGVYDKIPESSSMKDFGGNKIELAHSYSKISTIDDLNVMDLKDNLERLINRIRSWNSLERAPRYGRQFDPDGGSVT